MAAIFMILVMTAIQDGQQHFQVEDSSSFGGFQFLSQNCILNVESGETICDF